MATALRPDRNTATDTSVQGKRMRAGTDVPPTPGPERRHDPAATISSDRDDARAARDLAVAVVWLALGAGSLLLVSDVPTVGYTRAQAVVSVLAFAFGVWVFWRHGGRQVTAVGVYSLSSAAFVGYAGVYWLREDGLQLPGSLLVATCVGYFSHVVMYALYWRRWRTPPTRAATAPPEVSRWAAQAGVLLVLTCIACARVWPVLKLLTDAGAFVGVVLFAAGLSSRSAGPRLAGRRVLAVGGAVLLYVQAVFDGYGRLTVVGLATAVAIVLCTRFGTRAVKTAMLFGAPVAVIALGEIRSAARQALYPGVPDDSTVDSVSSMVVPLQTFARLLSSTDTIGAGDGSTFLATTVIFVPRLLWAGKPLGFGAELTRILEPQLISTGHSMAALASGEWFYNWRWAGLALMIPVVGIAVRAVDRLLSAASHAPLDTRRRLLALVAAAVAVAGIADYVWVGSFVYVARTGARLLVVLALLVYCVAGARLSARTRRAAPPATPAPRPTGTDG